MDNLVSEEGVEVCTTILETTLNPEGEDVA